MDGLDVRSEGAGDVKDDLRCTKSKGGGAWQLSECWRVNGVSTPLGEVVDSKYSPWHVVWKYTCPWVETKKQQRVLH